MDIVLDSAAERELDIINSIMDYAGLPSNFNVYRGDIDNAMAASVNGQRLIIYNKDLIDTIDKMANSYWSSVFIMAHEIGHHLANNILDSANSWKAELDADIFAASVLYKMGADSNQVALAVSSRFISNEKDTQTHPAKSTRLKAIRNAWFSAFERGNDIAIPPPPKNNITLYTIDTFNLLE